MLITNVFRGLARSGVPFRRRRFRLTLSMVRASPSFRNHPMAACRAPTSVLRWFEWLARPGTVVGDAMPAGRGNEGMRLEDEAPGTTQILRPSGRSICVRQDADPTPVCENLTINRPRAPR